MLPDKNLIEIHLDLVIDPISLKFEAVGCQKVSRKVEFPRKYDFPFKISGRGNKNFAPRRPLIGGKIPSSGQVDY